MFAVAPLTGSGLGRVSPRTPSSLLAASLLIVFLQSSFLRGDAWTPPSNYEDATFATTGSTITGNEDFGLSGATYFSIRTKFRLNLDHSDYGPMLRLGSSADSQKVLVLHQLGAAYGSSQKNGLYFNMQTSSSSKCGEMKTLGHQWPDPDTELDVVVTWNGVTAVMYVDGSQVATSDTKTSTCTAPSGLNEFRAGHTSSNGALQGTISFWTVWSGVTLTAQQVADMANGDYANIYTPVRHYALNEGTGSVADDYMGNGAQLSLSNSVTWTTRKTDPGVCVRALGFHSM